MTQISRLNEEGTLSANKMKSLSLFYSNCNIFLTLKCSLHNITYRCPIHFPSHNLVTKKSFLSRFVEDPLMFINSAISDETFCKLTVLIVNRIDTFYAFFSKSRFSHAMGGAIILFGYLTSL